MKIKTLLTAVFFFGFATVAGLMPTGARAWFENCSSASISVVSGEVGGTFGPGDPSNKLDFTVETVQSGQSYKASVTVSGSQGQGVIFGSNTANSSGNSVSFALSAADNVFNKEGKYDVVLEGPGIGDGGNVWEDKDRCLLGSYTVTAAYICGAVKIVQNNSEGTACFGGAGGCIEANKTTYIQASILDFNGQPAPGVDIIINIDGSGGGDFHGTTNREGYLFTSEGFSELSSGAHDITIELDDEGTNENLCSVPFEIATACTPELCNTDPTSTINNGGGAGGVNTELAASPFKLCEQIDATQFPDQYTQCVTCVGGEGEENKDGVWTAIGCIKREPQQIVVALTRLGLMVGGGIALLIMLASSFSLSVSQGDPKAKEEAKERITAAFVGLVFILFSVVIFQFMGVKVLQIPGIG